MDKFLIMEIILIIFWIYSKLCIFEYSICLLERSREVVLGIQKVSLDWACMQTKAPRSKKLTKIDQIPDFSGMTLNEVIYGK